MKKKKQGDDDASPPERVNAPAGFSERSVDAFRGKTATGIGTRQRPEKGSTAAGKNLRTCPERTVSNTRLKWSVCTSARRLADGFLLFQGPRRFNWLPFSAITEGSIEEAEELIRGNVSNYKRE